MRTRLHLFYDFTILILLKTKTMPRIYEQVGDFAILLRSGFSRWDAAKAQILTASMLN